MNLEFDYFTSISCGLFISSLILVICRLISYPITGVILALVLSSLLAAFLYHPSKKKTVNHKTIRATGASILFSLIFGIIFIIYYIPRFSSLLSTGDLSLSISILIVLAIVVIGGIIIGSIGGSIGSTFRDIFSLIKKEN
ncbi:MAG: hypothetical protein E7Z86_05825 [Methanosphaera stadtmanae]|jgi:uncharacterized protein involved in cysteine biosynthesis|nr:hypothetical protein [Methanosphaera stadtmanae]